MFTNDDLNKMDPMKLKTPPITYTTIIKLERDYTNPIDLAVACLNIGYYLGSLAPDTGEESKPD